MLTPAPLAVGHSGGMPTRGRGAGVLAGELCRAPAAAATAHGALRYKLLLLDHDDTTVRLLAIGAGAAAVHAY